jgi:hypothetical protein
MNAAAGDRAERAGDFLNTPAAAREFGVDVAAADDEADEHGPDDGDERRPELIGAETLGEGTRELRAESKTCSVCGMRRSCGWLPGRVARRAVTRYPSRQASGGSPLSPREPAVTP